MILPTDAVLDTWDPGMSCSYTTAAGYHLITGPGVDPCPAPSNRLPRQYRERAVTCIHGACRTNTWRADALCHHHQANR